MKVGVLALQGDVREHLSSLISCGVDAFGVRRAEEIQGIDALVLPGGESTTIAQLSEVFGVYDLIKSRIAQGMPTYGSCAGMILLADRIVDGIEGQLTFGGIDMTVRRNAFGRQVDSFESELDFAGHHLNAVFIRAPWVEELGNEVEVISSVITPAGEKHPVAVRQSHLMATSFHPELTHDLAVHRFFFDEVCK
jgi:5'-phosphate synthase pdxT subunit